MLTSCRMKPKFSARPTSQVPALIVLLSVVGSMQAAAQEMPRLDTIEGIIGAVHETLSGKAGEPRDWETFRSLFEPEARFITSPRLPDGDGFGYQARSIEEVVRSMDAWLAANDLYETPVHFVTEQFGRMAHVFCTYESRKKEDDETPTYGRGVSSFQLLNDGDRWWIVNWYWVGERPDSPIPDRYLPH